MYYRTIRNDILKSKVITFTTIVFIAAASLLVSLAAVLGINLSDAIDTMMINAKTPHFMQMHAGEIDTSRMVKFAEETDYVDAMQIKEFLNIDGAQIILGENSLINNVQDNGFSTQGIGFDYLLNLDGTIIHPLDGEVYVPICYMRDRTTKVGDVAVIAGKEFMVAGFLRDSQMNSNLASSKRFLISENDYKYIRDKGNVEYLIEFRLNDFSRLGSFEKAYVAKGLEANGPTLTYSLFKNMNAISDGLMIAVILLVSILVVLIALMSIRFTLLAKIEEEYREIGVMKAIGMRVSSIKKLYLIKYAVITATGATLGMILSICFRGILLENILLYMGEGSRTSLGVTLGILGVVIVFLVIMGYVNSVLKRFRSISPVQAIRFGTSSDKHKTTRYFSLNKNKLFHTNIFLGVQDVLSRKGLYITMLLVLIMTTFIIIVPQNLYNTMNSKKFIQYMGIGSYDLRIDLQQIEDITGKSAMIENSMDADADITKYAVLTTKVFTAKIDGQEENIKVEFGNHSIFPIEYSEGRAPEKEDEISLSLLNANQFEKSVGDNLTLITSSGEKNFKICGIYSDITNGGRTGKAVFKDDSADIMWSIISAKLKDQSKIQDKVTEYMDKFGYSKVTRVEEYINQIYGQTVDAIQKAAYAAIAISLLITFFITLLFMKMLIAKDRYSIAVLKAFGFTNKDIKIQYYARSLCILIVAVLMGTILANSIGQSLAGLLISSFGVSKFKFIINPLSAYLICPLLMAFVAFLATWIGTAGINHIKISENIKE